MLSNIASALLDAAIVAHVLLSEDKDEKKQRNKKLQNKDKERNKKLNNSKKRPIHHAVNKNELNIDVPDAKKQKLSIINNNRKGRSGASHYDSNLCVGDWNASKPNDQNNDYNNYGRKYSSHNNRGYRGRRRRAVNNSLNSEDEQMRVAIAASLESHRKEEEHKLTPRTQNNHPPHMNNIHYNINDMHEDDDLKVNYKDKQHYGHKKWEKMKKEKKLKIIKKRNKLNPSSSAPIDKNTLIMQFFRNQYIYKHIAMRGSFKIGHSSVPQNRTKAISTYNPVIMNKYDLILLIHHKHNINASKVDDMLKNDKKRGFYRTRDFETRGGPQELYKRGDISGNDELLLWFKKKGITVIPTTPYYSEYVKFTNKISIPKCVHTEDWNDLNALEKIVQYKNC